MENLGRRLQLAGLAAPGAVMLVNAAAGVELDRLGHVLVVLSAGVVYLAGRSVAALGRVEPARGGGGGD